MILLVRFDANLTSKIIFQNRSEKLLNSPSQLESAAKQKSQESSVSPCLCGEKDLKGVPLRGANPRSLGFARDDEQKHRRTHDYLPAMAA